MIQLYFDGGTLMVSFVYSQLRLKLLEIRVLQSCMHTGYRGKAIHFLKGVQNQEIWGFQ